MFEDLNEEADNSQLEEQYDHLEQQLMKIKRAVATDIRFKKVK